MSKDVLQISNKKKIRIAFVLYGDSRGHNRSFIETGILSRMAESFNITVCHEDFSILSGLKVLSPLKLQKIPKRPRFFRRVEGLFYLATLWRFRNRSRCHLARASLNIGNSKESFKWQGPVVGKMNLSFFQKKLVRTISISPFFYLLNLLIKAQWHALNKLKYKAFASNYDLLIIPYSGQISPDFDYHIWNCKKQSLPTLAIQENWDHLSSKSFFHEEPDFFGIWGKQSEGHLRVIQKKENCVAIVLGSPRFSSYFERQKETSIRISTFEDVCLVNRDEYILIGGTGDGHDDMKVISLVFSFFSKRNLFAKEKIKVVYRPHPFTRTRVSFQNLKESYPDLLIDMGARASSVGHLSDLVRNAKVNVNLLSTLVIESALAGVPCVVPTFIGENEGKYGYERALNEWDHLLGIQLIPTIKVANTSEAFELKMKEALVVRKALITPELKWIVGEENFTESLSQFIYNTMQ